MGKKGKKSKISKVKSKNIMGGKITKGKKTGSKSVVEVRKKLNLIKKLKERGKNKQNGKPVHDELETKDVLDMLDNEDLSYIRSSNLIRSQSVLNENSSLRHNKYSKKRPRGENEDLEYHYEMKLAKANESTKKVRVLLPTKTKQGLQMQTEEVDENEILGKMGKKQAQKSSKIRDDEEEEESDIKKVKPRPGQSNLTLDSGLERTEVTTGMLLASRLKKLTDYKMKIGILSASFLEEPNSRMRNLDSLLAMLITNDAGVTFTVPKLAAMSLVSVFQDVLPAYAIKHHNKEGIKLKKDTKELQSQEADLLRHYKTFLQRLEKIVKKFLHMRKSKQSTGPEAKLGFTALDCMCRMLISHPYFNMATNIVNFIIPFLNNWNPSIRATVSNAIRNVFRIDRRGEISYEIVRRINLLVKTKLSKESGHMRRDILDVLMGLRIKEVDLEKEKKAEMTPTGKMTYEERRMLSKRQRKKAKDMVLLEKELLEVSAEENKSKKSHYLTEITKLVFTMYFRALKTTPGPELLSSVLEGLAKFAHIISVDFFDDLLKVLNKLQSGGTLQQRQQLLCIATVLAVLDGQGSALALDPTAFHKNLYSSLINLKCGHVQSDVELTLRCLHLAIGKKKMPGLRAIAFAKRLGTVILQLEHHEAVAGLIQLKHILHTYINASALLNTGGTWGSGVYLPELDDPDHSKADFSTLWELTTLAEHYHPWVRQVVKNIVQVDKVEPIPKEIAPLSPEDISKKYDPYPAMGFTPDLPQPQLSTTIKSTKRARFSDFIPQTSTQKSFFKKMNAIDYDDFDELDGMDFTKKINI